VLESWEKLLVTAYGKADSILGRADEVFQKWVPGANGQPHRTFPPGTHFIQEEEPAAPVGTINEVMRRT
jgi:haloalkane dehalogenase